MDNRPRKKEKAKKRPAKKGVQAIHCAGTVVHYGTSKIFIIIVIKASILSSKDFEKNLTLPIYLCRVWFISDRNRPERRFHFAAFLRRGGYERVPVRVNA